MPEIGFPELILIAIVGLLVIGPDRLPETLRTLGLWLGRMRRSFNTVKAEIEKEIGMDEVKRQLHNEAIMEEMKRIEAEVKNTANTARSALNEGVEAAQPATPSIDPNVHSDVSDMIAAQDGGLNPPDPSPQDASTGDESPDRTEARSDDRDHSDAGPDDRDHSDAGSDDRDHTDAGASPEEDDPEAPDRQPPQAPLTSTQTAGKETTTPDQVKSG